MSAAESCHPAPLPSLDVSFPCSLQLGWGHSSSLPAQGFCFASLCAGGCDRVLVRVPRAKDAYNLEGHRTRP